MFLFFKETRKRIDYQTPFFVVTKFLVLKRSRNKKKETQHTSFWTYPYQNGFSGASISWEAPILSLEVSNYKQATKPGWFIYHQWDGKKF